MYAGHGRNGLVCTPQCPVHGGSLGGSPPPPPPCPSSLSCRWGTVLPLAVLAPLELAPIKPKLFLFLGPGHGKLAKSALQKARQKSLRIKDQSCPMLRLPHKAMW